MNYRRPAPSGAPRLLPVRGLPYDERTIYELGTSPPLLAGAFGFPSTDGLNEKIDTMLPSLTAWLRDIEFIDGEHWSMMVDTVTLIRLARDHDVDDVIFSNNRPERGALQGVTDGYLPEVLSLWHIVDMLGYRDGNVLELDLVQVLHTWCFMRLYEIMLLWAARKGFSRRKFPFYIAVNPPRYDGTWIHPGVVEAIEALDEISSPGTDEVEWANEVDEYIRQHRRKTRSPSVYSTMDNASLDRFSRSMPHPGEFSRESRRDSPWSPVTDWTLPPAESIEIDTSMYPPSREPTPPPGPTSADIPRHSPQSTISIHSSPRSDPDCAQPSSWTLSEMPSPLEPDEPAPPIPPRRRAQLWQRESWECPTPGRPSSPSGLDEAISEDDLKRCQLESTPPRLPSPMVPLEEAHLDQDGPTVDIPLRGRLASSTRAYRRRSPLPCMPEVSYLRRVLGSASPAKRRRSRSPEG
ncbi:hypothetical protein BJX68DRAFT_263634 [Aspergillus pseudodeflectus]|uniref:Uncharacterized protein n=1 Tax=Aspergillus pseudodeflectus TaxID=176178 RepID=A0ABR4KWE5_9EURO